MVDTLDLKSNGPYRPWGFKSPSGYRIECENSSVGSPSADGCQGRVRKWNLK
jgi:hypothetical protein